MHRFCLTLLLILLLSFYPAAAQDSTVHVQPDSTTVVQHDTGAETVVSNFTAWFEKNMNYFTITLLMALESSFIPIPSEIVLGPAAFFAADPASNLNIFLVLFFATVGSVIGALIIYGLSAWIGRKALYKFADSRVGTLLMLDSNKIKHAEDVFNKRSKTSVCLGRFIAGLRLFISIPAGLAKMNILNFIFFTFIGSAVYNTALALIGYFLHGQTDLIDKFYYEISVATIVLTILFVVFFIIRYFFIRYRKRRIYGLIGSSLKHSFSKDYFTNKFKKEKLNAQYNVYELKNLKEVENIFANKRLHGLNVTIPYKKDIITHIHELDNTANEIGAVNVLKFEKKNGKPYIKGFNTDAIGFERAITPYIKPYHTKALILGTGGASKAVEHTFKKLDIDMTFVSRHPQKENEIDYHSLSSDIMGGHLIIVNATPLGMYPLVNQYPDIPYEFITDRHLLFDVIYNPAETQFLKKGKQHHAQTVNGEKMLAEQAEESWYIWNKDN